MNAEYSKRALADLRRVAEHHIAAGERRVAEAVGIAIRQAIARLTQHPGSGRPVQQRAGVRVLLVPRYRYKIFHRIGATGPHRSHSAYVASSVVSGLSIDQTQRWFKGD